MAQARPRQPLMHGVQPPCTGMGSHARMKAGSSYAPCMAVLLGAGDGLRTAGAAAKR